MLKIKCGECGSIDYRYQWDEDTQTYELQCNNKHCRKTVIAKTLMKAFKLLELKS